MTQVGERRPFFRPHDDADEWEWRARMRRKGPTRIVLRLVVALVGLVLVLGGFALVPLPGPGWLVVILGLAVWASEIEPASDLLDWVKARVREWEAWLRRQSRVVQLAVALATFAVVATAVYVTLRITGLPAFVPDGLAGWLHTTVGL